MKKYDYLAKQTFLDPKLPYSVHWWNKSTTDYHCHVDFYELFLTIDDGFVHYYNDEQVKLEKHSVYFIPKGQYHRIDYTGKGESKILNMSVEPQFFEENVRLFSSALYTDIQAPQCLCVRLENSAYEFLLTLAKRATHYENSEMRLHSVRLFLAVTAACYRPQALPAKPFAKVQETLTSPQRYAVDLKMRLDSLEQIDGDIAEVYAQYPISPSLLISAFKELTGKTIVRYQIDRRMCYACTLLTNTDFTVLHIASEIGYDSLPHFTENFKKYTGLTPSQYRKENVVHKQNMHLSVQPPRSR